MSKTGDSFARSMLPVYDIRQSINIIRQCLTGMPQSGQIRAKLQPNPKGPSAEAYRRVESGRGALGHYIVNDGTPKPYRHKMSVPSVRNLAAMPHLLKGVRLADVILDKQANEIMTETGKEISFSDKMKYQLSANNTYVEGDPILINFTLMNLSNYNLWVLTWYIPLEGLKGKIFRVTCDGNDVPYEGPMMKRGQPNKDDYIQIYPGSDVSKKVDLSDAYQIHACNEAFVEFKGRIYYYTTSSDLIPKNTEEYQMAKITGNSLTFRVINP